MISGDVAQDLRQLAGSELARSTSAVAELGQPPQRLLHRPSLTTLDTGLPGYRALGVAGLVNACHHAAGSTRIAASPRRCPDAVRSAAMAVWMKGSVLL